jgi:hypothetical protein
VQTTWIAYTVLEEIIRAIDSGSVTPGKISHTLDQGLQVSTEGLTPDLRWGYEDMLGAARYPRMVNSSVTFQVVRDGRLVTQRQGFVNVGPTLLEAS